MTKILTQFTSSRSSLPPLVIATPTDHTHWSTPSHPVFVRLQLLAKESLSVLLNQSTSDFKVRPTNNVCTKVASKTDMLWRFIILTVLYRMLRHWKFISVIVL